MNKNFYRIIFNARRGIRMAVAETAASQGKSASGETGATATHRPRWSLTAFASLIALNCLLDSGLQAQVIADRNTPGNQQPTVLQTANGVPQVNIQNPSAAGVSRNVYSQFDVQSKGVLLNNSRTSVQTQQGGWVQGNPWLSTGSARVILNEVNSSNPSYLNGYVEVAGKRAEVVIANPSGISVNGGGFINTSKATLTTGTPIVNGGNLDGYRVQGGNININGNGLDLSATDYSAILARAVQINAGIWANELKVVTGANQIDAASLAANTSPVTSTIAGTGAVPTFALDVAQIGGMYAGKIHLIGTEQGLGVRSAGTIGSTGGDLVLQNNGWLTTTGTLQASANLQITTQGNIANSGTLYASNDQTLSTTGSVTNSGVIAAQGNSSIAANSLSSTLSSVLGAGIKKDGSLTSSGNLNVTTNQSLAANGQNLAAGNITLTGSSVDLSGSQTGAANIAITANSGNVNTANATVATSGTAGVLDITAKNNNNQTLDNAHGVLSAGQLNLDVANLTNTQGKITQTGLGDMSILLTSPTSTFNNTGGTVTANSANLNLRADTLTNTDGTVASNGNLTVAASSLTNNQGQVSALGNLTVKLNTTTGVLSNLQGLVAANGNVAITAASVDNTLGTLASVNNSLSVSTTNATTNDSGKIQAALDITLTNAGLSNTRTTNALATSTSPYGSIIGRNVDINTHTQTLNNMGGTIAASQTANLQTGALNNYRGLIQTGNHLVVNTHGQTLTNTNAANYTNSNTDLNGKGGLASQGTSTLTTGDLNNDAGYIGSKGAMTANSANISNTQSGQIQGLGNLSLTAGNGRTLGTINNTGGLIRSAANTSLNAGAVTNSNTSGTGLGIEGLDVSVSTTTLRNDNGAIRADNNITVTSAGTVDNSTGLMSAGNTLTLQDMQTSSSRTLAITNTNGTLLAGQSLVVAATSIGGDGSILSKGNLNLALNADFVSSGQVIANGNATLTTSGNVSNSGKLQAGNTLNLTANNIDNAATGEISANTTQVNASSTLTNRGLIDGVSTQVNANMVNNMGTGRIYGDHLSIAAVNLTNDTETIGGVTKAGTLAARERLDLGISGSLTNREHALIYSVGDMVIGGALDASRRATGSATTLNNNSATIEAGRNLSLSSATVNNTNDHFAYEIRVATTELDVREDINSGLYRVFTRTTYLPYQTTSDPAQILASGDINLNSIHTTNYASHILAGGVLNIGSSTLTNTTLMATKSVRDVGTTYTLVHVPESGICTWWLQYQCVRAHDEWQSGPYDSTANSTVAVAQVTTFNNSQEQIGSVASGTVNQPLGSMGNADARSGNITKANISAHQIGAVSVNTASGAHPNTTLPTSSLYTNNPSPTSAYLVETDTRFIDRKRWLGSDYMTQSLGLDPSVTQKRLGDGFYEQKLIREQVAQLTGRRFLADYTSDEQEYKALMNSAITFAQTYNLRPGIALTAQQAAQLTSDIVWLVELTVTLSDGSKQNVLVPQLYVKVQPGDLDGSGALLAGKDVNIKLTGDLTNTGTIAGRNVVSLTAENVNNLGGRIGGNDVSVAARQDLNNIGGSIGAVNSLSATAGRDLNIQTTTQSTTTRAGIANNSRTNIDRIAGLYVSGTNGGKGGTLVASAGRDFNIVAGEVSNAGSGTTSLSAGNNFTLATVNTGEQNNITWNADNHLNYGNTQTAGSTIQGGGNVNLKAGKDLTATAANVQATQALGVQAAGNVNILAGQATQTQDQAYKHASSGFLSTTTTTRQTNASTTAIASSIEGNSVTLTSGQDTTIKGSNVLAEKDLTIKATGNVTIEAAKNSATSNSYRETRESGLMSGGGMGFSIGTREQSTDQNATSTSAAASTVGSLAGNVTITAGKTYTQTGSDVLTPAGNIDITAQTVNITEARENSTSQVDTRFKQEGITVSVSNPVLSAAQSIQNMDKAASQTSSGRMKALAAASTGLAAYSAYTAIDNGMGTMINGKKDQIATGTDSAGKQTSRDSTLIDKAGGFNVNVGIGSSSSESTSRTGSDSARGSSIAAGGNVNIKATGAGTNSNLTIQGANVQAGGDTSLQADNKVNLTAAANTNTQTSTNSNSGASVGMGIGTNGLTVNASMSQGNGRGDGTDTMYINTQVSGKVLKITSGGDTNLQGAVVRGSAVKADVGGNLNIETLQDKSTYAETQSTSGFSVSVPIGPGKASGSINASNTDIKGKYQSANQQSGIQVGDGGFQVSVAGNTDLKGGVIASTDKAIADNKNSLTTSTLTASEVKNQASASVTTTGFNVGTNMFTEGTYGLTKGIGANMLDNASQNSSSSGQTRSAVSAGSITITDEAKQQQTTGNTASQTIASFNRDTTNANTIAQRQDIEAIKRSVEAERAIKNEAVRQITTLTNEAYRVMFKEVPKFYKVTCPAGVECTKNPEKATSTLVKGSAQEVQAELAKAPAGAVLAVNGIDNPLDRAGQLAMQNAEPVRDSSGNEAKPTTIYLMHYVPSNNGLSELLVAGYEKKLAPTLGYSTQDQAYADGLKTLGANTGGDVVSLGHSRGTIVQTNANAILASEGVTKPNLSVQGVGGAVSADEYTKAAEKVVGQKNIDNVTFSYFNNDPIPVGAAGNPGVLSLSEFWKVLTTANSAHSCYGTGASGCQQVQILSPNAPDKAVQDNSNLIQYKGGIPYDGNGNLIVIKK